MRYAIISDTASHASTRGQARTDGGGGGGGEKKSSVPEKLTLCSLDRVCGQPCIYRHIARCVLPPQCYHHLYQPYVQLQ